MSIGEARTSQIRKKLRNSWSLRTRVNSKTSGSRWYIHHFIIGRDKVGVEHSIHSRLYVIFGI
jgi:hypothetical protein